MINRAIRKLFNAETPPPIIWEPTLIGKVNPNSNHVTLVKQGISRLPIELQDKYNQAGHSIFIPPKIQDAADFLPGTRDHLLFDKGWDILEALQDADHCHGAYFTFDNHIVIPQIVTESKFSSKVKAQADYFVLHEIGHLFNEVESDEPTPLSASEEFIHTGMEDLRLATCKPLINKTFNGKNIVMALHDGNGLLALNELFADLFAECMTGQKDMSALTPNAARLVQNQIDSAIENHRARFIAGLHTDIYAPHASA